MPSYLIGILHTYPCKYMKLHQYVQSVSIYLCIQQYLWKKGFFFENDHLKIYIFKNDPKKFVFVKIALWVPTGRHMCPPRQRGR